MKKKIFIVVALALFIAMPLGSAFATESFIQPTETLQWKQDKCYNGYNAFTLGNGDMYLIDMQGQVVKRFAGGDNPGSGYWQILESGNIRACINAGGATPRAGYGGGPGAGIQELDWDGNVLWRWIAYDDGGGDNNTFRQHHDYRKIYNKALGEYTYLALTWVKKGADDAVALGTDPQYYGSSKKGWTPCALWEIRPKWGQIEEGLGVEVVWYWTFADHFVTKVDNGSLATSEFIDAYGRPNAPVTLVGDGETLADYPGKLDINGVHYTAPDGPRADMQHCNSFDYDEATGHIAINAKACNEFFVIDHDGTFVGGGATGFDAAGALARTSAGDFAYRFGNPGNYDAGEPAGWFDEGDMEMYGSHNIEFIDPYHWKPPVLATDTWPAPTAAYALPGGGALNANGRSNFMIYDNGCYNPVNRVSKVLEINPYIKADGTLSANYVDPGPFQAPGLKRRDQVPWEFSGTEAEFYSLHISGAHRLPNGNTIVCAGRKGHFFEVTADKEVVWEYVVPYRNRDNDIAGPAGFTAYLGQGDDNRNSVFRFTRYGPDYPGLAGKDLTPGSTLTGRIPMPLGSGDVYPEEVTYTGWGADSLSGEGGGGDAGGGGGGGGAGY